MDTFTFFKKARPGDKARVDAVEFKQLLEEHKRLLDKLAVYETKQLPAVSDLMYRGETTFGNHLTPKDLSKLGYNKDVRVAAGELKEVCDEYKRLTDENLELRAKLASTSRELSKLNAVLSATSVQLDTALETLGASYTGNVYDVSLTKGIHFDRTT